MRLWRGWMLMVLSLLITGGCAERLPHYPWVDSQTARQTMAQQAAQLHTLTSNCDISLQGADGRSVRLDGAVAARWPGFVRMRAWKMGQAVFDLTMTPQGVWVVWPEQANRREQMIPAGASAARFAQAWDVFGGRLFSEPDVTVEDIGGREFTLRQSLEQQTLVCRIDRSTLTVQQYQIMDNHGQVRFTLSPRRYRLIGGIAWPTSLIAQSDTGRIELNFADVEINGALPQAAFTPPRRAEKLP